MLNLYVGLNLGLLLFEKKTKNLEIAKDNILGFDDHNFNTYKQSVLVKIKEKDVNVFQVGSRFWDEIVKHYFQFDKH